MNLERVGVEAPMICPVCRHELDNPLWSRCPTCRLTWVREVRVLEDGQAPWPQDDRQVRIGWPTGDVVLWFVFLPIGLLGAAAVLLSLHNLMMGSGWLRFVGAAVGIPLGAMTAWGFIRGFGRFVANLFLLERIDVKAGAARIQLRGEAWLRSDVSFPLGELTSVRLSIAQGLRAHVWLMHRAGPLLLVTTLTQEEARSMLMRVSGSGLTATRVEEP